MDPVVSEKRLHVVVGILQDAEGRVLIQKRRAGTPKPGKWEFPGGKLERGEQPWDGLTRELSEELGIEVITADPLTKVTHDYDHANVRLDTYLVSQFDGEPAGMEGQRIAWTTIEKIGAFDVLEAVWPIVLAIKESRQSLDN